MNQSLVEQSGRVSWVASLLRQLLKEVRVAPVGFAARARVVEIHARSVSRLERGLALEVVDELNGITLPFCGQQRSRAGLGVAPGGRVSRVDRLLVDIETAQLGQLRQHAEDRFGPISRLAGVCPSHGSHAHRWARSTSTRSQFP